MRRINLYLPEDLIEKLTAMGAKKGETFSSLTRKVLQQYAEGQLNILSSEDMVAKQSPEKILEDFIAQNDQKFEIQESELKEIKAVLDLVLHYAKRAAQ